MKMGKVINAIEELADSEFTEKATLHFHLGVVKKIMREEEITPKKLQAEKEPPKDVT